MAESWKGDLIQFLQVDLLKHNIPDPSLLTSSTTQDKENKNDNQSGIEDYIADLCFVHARWTLLSFMLVCIFVCYHMLISFLMNKEILLLFPVFWQWS